MSVTEQMSPEISLRDITRYVVLVDNEIKCYVENIVAAKLAVDSLAEVESKARRNKWIKIYREDVDDLTAVLSEQKLGHIYNSALNHVATVRAVAVQKAKVVARKPEVKTVEEAKTVEDAKTVESVKTVEDAKTVESVPAIEANPVESGDKYM